MHEELWKYFGMSRPPPAPLSNPFLRISVDRKAKWTFSKNYVELAPTCSDLGGRTGPRAWLEMSNRVWQIAFYMRDGPPKKHRARFSAPNQKGGHQRGQNATWAWWAYQYIPKWARPFCKSGTLSDAKCSIVQFHFPNRISFTQQRNAHY